MEMKTTTILSILRTNLPHPLRGFGCVMRLKCRVKRTLYGFWNAYEYAESGYAERWIPEPLDDGLVIITRLSHLDTRMDNELSIGRLGTRISKETKLHYTEIRDINFAYLGDTSARDLEMYEWPRLIFD